MYQQRQDQKLYTQSKLHCGRTPCLLDGLQMSDVMHFASGTLAISSNSNFYCHTGCIVMPSMIGCC